MEFIEKASINDVFKEFIRSGNYENVIFRIMNDSKIMFPGTYIHNDKQSNGECDFYDRETNEKYDAKLPFTSEQGRLIGSRNGNLSKFLESMAEEGDEFYDIVIDGKHDKDIHNLFLYKVMNEKILKDKEDENLIFLFPYPIISDYGSDSMMQFVGNILTYIFETLRKDNDLKTRKIFVIYPCYSGEVGIICSSTDYPEYLVDNYLEPYFHYTVE